ncbi:SURF1 family protein [Methylobacterium oryzisoli]|uniref:SURF1 family protein n=1 Tax=Methylobacterium oryzisoli TaxID=3385502 RepID=UPI0038917F12
MEAAVRPVGWRSLVGAGLATLVCLAILLGLGTWQLQRKAWKEGVIRQIVERSRIEPPLAPPAPGAWNPASDEFKHVRATGRFQHERETLVHGLAPGEVPGRALQGYYVITPLARDDGPTILVNRGFVPTELRDPAARAAGQVTGPVTVTGMLRASEPRGLFVPAPNPEKGEWYNRDIPGIAQALALAEVTPYLIEADATPNPGGWPRGGQLRVDLPNNHLQYAFTWYGIALCLVGVFGAFAWTRLRPQAGP